MTSTVDRLCDLIAIPSVSAESNLPVIDYVAARLNPEQWTVARDTWTDTAGIAKANLIAISRNAPGQSPELTFVCHTDTVPFETNWNEAVRPAVRDGRVYGRGSCDVKGYLACVLEALDRVNLTALAKPVALILTADEEIGCLGAKRLAAAKPLTTRYMIIGEPTGLRPMRAGKGYGLATITVRGREAHSAYPSVGRSAVYDAARVITAIEQVSIGMREFRSELDLDPPFTTLNIGLIQGGTAKNIVAGECKLTLEWRPIPGQDPRLAIDRVAAALAELKLDLQLDILRVDRPFTPSASHRIADLLSSMTTQTAAAIPFGSEATHLGVIAEEAVVRPRRYDRGAQKRRICSHRRAGRVRRASLLSYRHSLRLIRTRGSADPIAAFWGILQRR